MSINLNAGLGFAFGLGAAVAGPGGAATTTGARTAAAASFGMLSYPSHSALLLYWRILCICFYIMIERGLRNVTIWHTP